MRLINGKNGGCDFIDLKPAIADGHALENFVFRARGRARHHSGISACENRTGTERAKKKRDLRRNGCLMETETVRCIVCRTIYDTHTEFHASVFPLSRAKRVRFPIFHPKPLTLQR